MRKLSMLTLLLGCAVQHKEFTPGGVGGQCYANGTCNSGLTCQDGYCFPPPDARTPDARPDARVDGPASYRCNDDLAYEPNEAYNAAPTLAAGSYPSMAICPAGDLDYFRFDASATATLDVTVTYDPSQGATLQLTLLNSTGQPLVQGQPVVGQPDRVHARAANVPPGAYYAFVRDEVGTHESNYAMDAVLQ